MGRREKRACRPSEPPPSLSPSPMLAFANNNTRLCSAHPNRSLSGRATPPAKKAVGWHPTNTVFFFQRQLGTDKMPSDALAPLGLGALVNVAQRPLQFPVEGDRRVWIQPVPLSTRHELLADVETTAEDLAEVGKENCRLLADINDTRMSLMREAKAQRVGLKRCAGRDIDDEDYENVEGARHPSQRQCVERAAADGDCEGCRRQVCMCIEIPAQ